MQSMLFAASLFVPAIYGAETAFPAVQFLDLNKNMVSVPGGLKGRKNLVIVAFLQKQQEDINTWLKLLPAMMEGHPELAYYEFPVIEKMNSLIRWVISNGMRGGIPDKAQRERTITLYIDKKPFKEALKIPDEKRIYLFMIDKTGEVLWRCEGPATPEKQQLLKEYLGTL